MVTTMTCLTGPGGSATRAVVAVFVGATVDSLWYSTYAMVLALFIGLCGTVWRFTHPARLVRTAAPRRWLPG